MCRHQNHAATSILSKVRYIFRFLQVLAAAILDHHYLSAQNKIQCFHCIRHMWKPMHRPQNYASTLIIIIKSYVRFSKSSNFSDGHLGFMQIKKIPQSCHSGKRCIWLLEALSNTNPSKKLTVPTISGFTMGHIQLATRLLYLTSLGVHSQARVDLDCQKRSEE